MEWSKKKKRGRVTIVKLNNKGLIFVLESLQTYRVELVPPFLTNISSLPFCPLSLVTVFICSYFPKHLINAPFLPSLWLCEQNLSRQSLQNSSTVDFFLSPAGLAWKICRTLCKYIISDSTHLFLFLLLFVLQQRTLCPLQLLRKKRKQTQEQGVHSKWADEECNRDVERKQLCNKLWLPFSLDSCLSKCRHVRHKEPLLPVCARWRGSAFWVDHAVEDKGNLWHTMAKWFINVLIIKLMMLG